MHVCKNRCKELCPSSRSHWVCVGSRPPCNPWHHSSPPWNLFHRRSDTYQHKCFTALFIFYFFFLGTYNSMCWAHGGDAMLTKKKTGWINPKLYIMQHVCIIRSSKPWWLNQFLNVNKTHLINNDHVWPVCSCSERLLALEWLMMAEHRIKYREKLAKKGEKM